MTEHVSFSCRWAARAFAASSSCSNDGVTNACSMDGCRFTSAMELEKACRG